jgi:hypothetical protein
MYLDKMFISHVIQFNFIQFLNVLVKSLRKFRKITGNLRNEIAKVETIFQFEKVQLKCWKIYGIFFAWINELLESTLVVAYSNLPAKDEIIICGTEKILWLIAFDSQVSFPWFA